MQKGMWVVKSSNKWINAAWKRELLKELKTKLPNQCIQWGR